MISFKFFLIGLMAISLISCKKEITGLSLTIVKFEKIDSETAEYVKSVLEEEFMLSEVKIIPMKLPDEAYYKPHNRYRADKLIRYLCDNSDTQKIIGITEKDI